MKPIRRQHGQALVEFLVLALAIVPLFLLMPMIAKYQDISEAAQAASRYVAFEAMTRNAEVSTWQPEAQLGDEVRRRFFGNTAAPVKTGDVAGNTQADRNPFWRDPHGHPLITSFADDVTVSFGPGRAASHAGAYTSASDGALFMLRDPLQLESRGIYTANVTVKLANLPANLKFLAPFNTLDLSLTRSTSVVLDAWTGKGAEQVEGKVMGNAAVFPSGQLAGAAGIAAAAVVVIDAPGSIPAPKLGELSFWRDVVPQARLK